MTDDTRSLLRAFDGHPGRRALLRGLVAAGAAGAPLLRFADALAQAPDQAVAQITVLSQPGVVADIVRDVSVPIFHRSYPKTAVALDIGSNAAAYPRMLAQRSNPVVSGGMFNDLFAQRGIADAMWTRFDRSLVPNAQAVPQAIMTPGGFGIPLHLTPVGIMYNPDRVEKPTSWTDLWKPQYKGRVSMWSAWYDGYIMAAVATGKGPDVIAGIKAWEPYKANIGAWVNSPTGEEDMVDRGEVWLCPHWGSWAAMAQSQGKKVAFTIPKEGGLQWTGHMQVCAGFPSATTELTQRYLDTWLSDECQLAWIERGFYSPASTRVQIPPGLRDNPAIISAQDASDRLVHADYATLGHEMPRIQAMIDHTLRA